MTELLAPESAANTTTVMAAASGATIGTASYLSHYAAVGRLGFPGEIASNPIREADDSSPWWQSRMVCKVSMHFDEVPKLTQPEPKGLLGQIVSYLRGKRALEAPARDASFEPIVYVDLGSGAVTALPIGTLMPVQQGWSWKPEVDHLPAEETGFLSAERATTEVASLPGGEPEWNEADDELPTWIKLDSIEYRSGALMSRRRAPDSSD